MPTQVLHYTYKVMGKVMNNFNSINSPTLTNNITRQCPLVGISATMGQSMEVQLTQTMSNVERTRIKGRPHPPQMCLLCQFTIQVRIKCIMQFEIMDNISQGIHVTEGSASC